MDANVVTLEIANDGTVTLPVNLVRALGLSSHQNLTVEIREDALVLTPSPQQRLNRIGQLLRSALEDVEWSEIEAGRDDRCF